MIDDQRKFIFVENPKTATFSIKLALMGKDSVYDCDDPRMSTINHNTPMLIKKKYPKRWSDYPSFVVVRNTWDRAHSFFHFYRNIAGAISYRSMSFDKWVSLNFPPPAEDYLRCAMHAEGRFDDVLCQLRYAEEVDEIIVLQSCKRHEQIIELQNGFECICNKLGLDLQKVPLKGNNYGRTENPIVWKEETVEYIKYKYEEEIVSFGFEEPLIGE